MKTLRMPKKSAQKWFAALRSGQYQQGFDVLCTQDNQYCCLGVLEHCLTGKVESVCDGLPSWEWLERHHITFFDLESGRSTVRAPSLPTERDKDGFIMNAAGANDEGYSFERLADLLEQATEFTDGDPTSQATEE